MSIVLKKNFDTSGRITTYCSFVLFPLILHHKELKQRTICRKSHVYWVEKTKLESWVDSDSEVSANLLGYFVLSLWVGCEISYDTLSNFENAQSEKYFKKCCGMLERSILEYTGR